MTKSMKTKGRAALKPRIINMYPLNDLYFGVFIDGSITTMKQATDDTVIRAKKMLRKKNTSLHAKM